MPSIVASVSFVASVSVFDFEPIATALVFVTLDALPMAIPLLCSTLEPKPKAVDSFALAAIEEFEPKAKLFSAPPSTDALRPIATVSAVLSPILEAIPIATPPSESPELAFAPIATDAFSTSVCA